ncbi:uncharacterized protein METZ01_LOCUS299091, partial [marine metagenome]
RSRLRLANSSAPTISTSSRPCSRKLIPRTCKSVGSTKPNWRRLKGTWKPWSPTWRTRIRRGKH